MARKPMRRGRPAPGCSASSGPLAHLSRAPPTNGENGSFLYNTIRVYFSCRTPGASTCEVHSVGRPEPQDPERSTSSFSRHSNPGAQGIKRHWGKSGPIPALNCESPRVPDNSSEAHVCKFLEGHLIVKRITLKSPCANEGPPSDRSEASVSLVRR